MKVLMLSHSDGGGGAGRASYRLLRALDDSGVDASMRVDFKNTDDPRVQRSTAPGRDALRRARITIEEVPAYLARFPQPRLFSPGLVSGISTHAINQSDADVVNLQWINFGFLSVKRIGAITKPLTWNMHDMWAFTGGLNYDADGPDARWRTGFASRQTGAGQWWDVDRWVWRRKVKHWKRPITLIASSSWMASLAKESELTSTWPVAVIPNPVDVHIYQPGSQEAARNSLGIPQDVSLVLAFFPRNLGDPRKGFDLFVETLERLAQSTQRAERPVHIAIAGHDTPPTGATIAGLPTHWLGYLDDIAAISAYRAADVMVVPSRQDNSPQAATEALACGTPVVAFNVSGLPDFIDHQSTGYLATAFETQDLASGIERILASADVQQSMSTSARQRAESQWSYPAVGSAHAELFAQVIEDFKRR